jgi:hypothetical protein
LVLNYSVAGANPNGAGRDVFELDTFKGAAALGPGTHAGRKMADHQLRGAVHLSARIEVPYAVGGVNPQDRTGPGAEISDDAGDHDAGGRAGTLELDLSTRGVELLIFEDRRPEQAAGLVGEDNDVGGAGRAAEGGEGSGNEEEFVHGDLSLRTERGRVPA